MRTTRINRQPLFPLALAVFSAAMSVGGASHAQASDAKLAIELNRVASVTDACRMSFVFTNRMDMTVEALSIETVLFDKQGSVERFLVLKSRPLSPSKIRVQQFDVKGIDCAALGRVLLNDVKACTAGDLSPAGCLEHIEPSSRASVPFVSTAISN